jgi:hypothetical protein
MTRIYIIGGPGSGKTTLAKRLSQQLAIPCYDMDRVGWEGGFGAQRPLDVRLHDVHEIVMQTEWIAEGWFSPWTNELCEYAEHIIWLDLPWRIARWRIFTRHMRTSLAGTNKHRGLLQLYRFIGCAKDFYESTYIEQEAHTRLALSNDMQPYLQKVVHCRHPAEVEALSYMFGLKSS